MDLALESVAEIIRVTAYAPQLLKYLASAEKEVRYVEARTAIGADTGSMKIAFDILLQNTLINRRLKEVNATDGIYESMLSPNPQGSILAKLLS